MKTKHTPGPCHSGCLVTNTEGNGCQCTCILSEGYAGSITTIDVWNGIDGIENGDNDSPKREEAIANNKLIAAAPELLEACIEALLHHQGGHSEIGFKLREAIKKATE